MKSDRKTFNQFIRALVELLEAGLPVRKALEGIALSAVRTKCGRLSESVLQYVLEGFALSSAIQHNSVLFVDSQTVSLMSAAEKTGNVVPALRFLISEEEQREETAAHLKEVSLYPTLVLCVAGAGTFVLLRQYRQFSFSEPPQGALESCLKAGLFLLSFLILFCIVYYRIFKADTALLFFYETGFLLSSGLSITDALHIISASNNGKAALMAGRMLPEVRSGVPFARVFQKACPEMKDPELLMFLDLSSADGNLASACSSIWARLRKKTGRKKQTALRMAEPLLLTGTGICLLILLQGAVLPFLTSFGGIL